MDNTKTEIVLVIDRSGSMYSMRHAVIEGFNTFIAEQKKTEGTARVSLYTFNDAVTQPLHRVPLQEVPQLNHNNYEPGGCTALLDAVGTAIDTTGRQLAALPEAERPGSVIIGIMTDGYENASSDYSWADVAQRIQHQKEKYSWRFMFFGAGEDTFDVAKQMHIEQKDSVIWHAGEAKEVKHVMKAQSGRISAARRMAINMATEEDCAILSAPLTDVVDSLRTKSGK